MAFDLNNSQLPPTPSVDVQANQNAPTPAAPNVPANTTAPTTPVPASSGPAVVQPSANNPMTGAANIMGGVHGLLGSVVVGALKGIEAHLVGKARATAAAQPATPNASGQPPAFQPTQAPPAQPKQGVLSKVGHAVGHELNTFARNSPEGQKIVQSMDAHTEAMLQHNILSMAQVHQMFMNHLEQEKGIASINDANEHFFDQIQSTGLDPKETEKHFEDLGKSQAQGITNRQLTPLATGGTGADAGLHLFSVADLAYPLTKDVNIQTDYQIDPKTDELKPTSSVTLTAGNNTAADAFRLHNSEILKGQQVLAQFKQSQELQEKQADISDKNRANAPKTATQNILDKYPLAAAMTGQPPTDPDKIKEWAQDVQTTNQQIESGSLLAKLQNNPAELAGDKAAPVIALADAKVADPSVPAADKVRWQAVGNQARSAQKIDEDSKVRIAATKAAAEDNGGKHTDVFGNTSTVPSKEFDRRYDKFNSSKQYQNLQTLQGSYDQFKDVVGQINAGKGITGPESVVALFNAIGISAEPLAGKGFRINQNTIQEHVDARGIGQSAYQKLLKLKSGEKITPQQVLDYANIAKNVFQEAYINTADEEKRQLGFVDVLPTGNNQPVDPVTKQIYLRVAGGNEALADKALAASGWQVNPVANAPRSGQSATAPKKKDPFFVQKGI